MLVKIIAASAALVFGSAVLTFYGFYVGLGIHLPAGLLAGVL